jgi:transcriptional regulator with XRE-family HTH domain
MSFVSLQEQLRKEMRRRIEAGELTGMELARRTGFTQAHISNFLNHKRGLKLAAQDRMLKAIGLSVYDLLNPHDLARFAAVPASTDEEYASVALVSGRTAAASAVIVNDEVQELVRFRRSFLGRLRPDGASPARKSWTRFVLLKADARDAACMWPRLAAGSLLLLDRHYTSLRPYRKNDRNLYAVCRGEGCAVRYAELAGGQLILRPHQPDAPVEVVSLPQGQTAAGLLAGRIAHISMEL